MKEANLLKLEDRIDSSGSGRKFVKFRKVMTVKPFDCLEMDIKIVWIPSAGKKRLSSIFNRCSHAKNINKPFCFFN
ncbi:hypothetical protein [Psychroserpens burtonensis]|uniref:hypothetical protein n=1 Tax=Psychroserpens burtonensis TaxID=49278 RepID=UPI0021C46631|nr:hypothetical protein [Psychroserpens burtonensis]